MRLGIHTRNFELPSEERERLERRVRLLVGGHATEVSRVSLTFSKPSDGSSGVASRLAIRSECGGEATFVSEATDLGSATDLAVWRLAGWLRRRGLQSTETRSLRRM